VLEQLVADNPQSITGDYISGRQSIAVPKKRKKATKTLTLKLKYYDDKPVIDSLKRISKPSLRVYVKLRGGFPFPFDLIYL
jgi:ribosomal protein S8